MKPVKVSNATHQLLVRVQGELQAQLAKRLTVDDMLQLLVREHAELGRRRQEDEHARRTAGTAAPEHNGA